MHSESPIPLASESLALESAAEQQSWPLLAEVDSPERLKLLPARQLENLAAQIRDFLIEKLSRTGGHLGPNLGVVELTLALHRVFASPKDRLIFDVGHQAYVHKMLTGRQAGFDELRSRGGLSGYPSQAESGHDLVENSHASTALSYADGLAKAYALRGERDRAVVAIVGDGALTGGMCWEALNNIAASPDRPVIIVVNDNGRSYSPTIGGLAEHLASLRLSPNYERALSAIHRTLLRTPLVGHSVRDVLRGIRRGLKDALLGPAMFEDLGLKYVGPVDGHDIGAMETALRLAAGYGHPVIVHAITRKGYGYHPAEYDEADCLHSSSAFDPETGKAISSSSSGVSWTSVFAKELVSLASKRESLVGITAAMAGPTGIEQLMRAYPERAFDVGIAEQHAVTSAAGLAMGGMHPVVAVYATFLNRAYDQLLLDVGLHRLPVTFVLDRAGITGPDGPSHYGIWDLAIGSTVPGLRIAAPRDAVRLREQLAEAVAVTDGPTMLRFPTGSTPLELPAVDRIGQLDVLHRDRQPDVLFVAVGAFGELGVQAAQRAGEQGIGVTVVDPCWVIPPPTELIELARQYRLVVTAEDGLRCGGVGTAIAQHLADAQVTTPVRCLGVPTRFVPHGSRAQILTELGLTPQQVARTLTEWVLQLAKTDSVVSAP